MGFESFRVELRGGAVTHPQADAAVRRLPHAKPDPASRVLLGSTYYTVEDDTHVIEIEVSAQPVRLSCRFTLCHPSTVDVAFLGVARELATALEMDVVCLDPPAEGVRFPPERFPEFAEAVRAAIAAQRAMWITQFGAATLAATISEVYEKVILPRCEPVAG